MTPLDLAAAPPRSPRVELDGLVMLARTIDKFRGQLPGGNPGAYVTHRGLTTLMLEMLGVTHEQLRAVVEAASSDGDVVQWLREHADHSRYATINDRLKNWTLADNPPERWEFIDALYPNRRPGPRGEVNVFEMLDQDDSDCFRL
jgi:hypothetical protein